MKKLMLLLVLALALSGCGEVGDWKYKMRHYSAALHNGTTMDVDAHGTEIHDGQIEFRVAGYFHGTVVASFPEVAVAYYREVPR